MKIDLTNDELAFIAKALKSHAHVAVESECATEAEIAGRALCAKFLASINIKEMGREAYDIEHLLDEARQDFCGIGNDGEMSELCRMANAGGDAGASKKGAKTR